ncbi:phosphatidylinositol transfer protein csr1 [Purpureocillium takamizusanense]|uniref:Phosphatidylinositol transfer protein csr1 n=1 Tax=Purpureocillium takamizusanense TaxID=2060973 RepID=A0A9Q8QE82_9HYPO|nr:phosphatidylinositol transfer protein csr1 [Purpureocillium takamizusanense]UNI17296.1 phosphatidylinositol transfer protein csr1 [Purpureocillium takamizusanense]
MRQRNTTGIVNSAIAAAANYRQGTVRILLARVAPAKASSSHCRHQGQPLAALNSAAFASASGLSVVKFSPRLRPLTSPATPGKTLQLRLCDVRHYFTAEPHRLQSSTVFSPTLLVVVVAIIVASWTATRIAPLAIDTTSPDPTADTDTDTRPSPDTTGAMSIDAIAQGHLGNLTPEQEQKLRQLWNAFFKVCGIAEESGSSVDGATTETPSKVSTVKESEAPQKKRFSLFRWGGNESTEGSTGTKAAEPDDNDKYGQTKDYHKTLENNSPESIRQTIWSMVKHDHPDALLLRFLRARKWDVEKALVMLISAMNWRHNQMNLDDDIMKNGEAGAIEDEKNGNASAKKRGVDFMAQLRMGKSFLHGTDKEGRPICIVRVRLHKPGEQSSESLERYTVFIIETARLVLEPPVDTATIIFDMSDFTLSNMDYQPVKFMVQCFEANYPESLGAVLVHNAPWVFQGIWKIIRGWLDPVVAAKVHFTNYRAGLEEFIPPDHIIKELDGDEDWKYKYKEPAEGENEAMKDTETRERLLKARAVLYGEFEAATRTWIRSADSEQGKQAKAEREQVAEKLRVGYWGLDPYIRSRSLYDRTGDILPSGKVNWYNKADTGSTKEAGNDNKAQA